MGAPNGAPKAYYFLPFCHSGAGLRGGGAVKGGVGEIDVFGIHLLLAQPQALANTINMKWIKRRAVNTFFYDSLIRVQLLFLSQSTIYGIVHDILKTYAKEERDSRL